MSETPEPAETPRQEGISLDELAAAFAQAMGGHSAAPSDTHPDQPTEATSPEQSTAETPPVPEAPEPSVSADDEACPISPESIFEAMLFVGDPNNEPLTPSRAASLMRGVEAGEIPQIVDALNRRYEAGACPYRIVGEGAGYRLTLTPEFDRLRTKVLGRAREARLSQAAIDVLAIVAYQQPLTADDVSRLRGTPSNHILSHLVRRRLLRIERAAEKPRTARYYTTDRFLELFGLESLEDIPQSEELERR